MSEQTPDAAALSEERERHPLATPPLVLLCAAFRDQIALRPPTFARHEVEPA